VARRANAEIPRGASPARHRNFPNLGDLAEQELGGASMVYMHDVAHVHNAVRWQVNVVHVTAIARCCSACSRTVTLDARHRHGIKKMLTIITPSLPDDSTSTDRRSVGGSARLDRWRDPRGRDRRGRR